MTNASAEKPEPFDLNSDDVAARKRADLKQLFPEAFNEDKIDFDQLRRSMGEWIDEGSERFGLTWPGKAACMKVIQAPATGALRPDRDESVNFDESENIFIEGDNLEVLKLLQKAYFSKIKMIYIDPPYNTGNEFIYPDKFAENLDTYLKYTRQVDAEGVRFSTNSESHGRFHSRWLNMMYPRLYLAKNLLRPDGLIFISIDDNEATHLKLVCDHIFGENNFIEQMIWKNKYGSGALTKGFANVHEYVLVYGGGDVRNISAPLNDEQRASYKSRDDKFELRGGYVTQPLATNSKDDRPNLQFPIIHEGTEIWPEKQWVWSKERVEQAQRNDELVINQTDGKFSVRMKQYLRDENGVERLGKPVSISLGPFNQEGTKEIKELFGGAVFDFPKPSNLVRNLFSFVINDEEDDDGIYLDFFAGSSASAHGLMKVNQERGGKRKFIMVQLPEPVDEGTVAGKAGFGTIAEISRERIRRAEKAIGQEALSGFRAFKLAASSFAAWEVSSDTEVDNLLTKIQAHSAHTGNEPDDDILFELLLKDGFELSTKAVEVSVAGSKVYSVANGALLICLERNLTKEIIDAVADLAEETAAARVVCLDAGFQGNDQLKTNAVQTFKSRLGHGEDTSIFRTV